MSREDKEITARIIAVGRELLTGRVLDTNSNYLAGKLTGAGFKVTAIWVIDDELDEIAGAVREAVRCGTKVAIFTGGLGPTPDDMTLKGIARGLGVKLVKRARALKFIKSRYEELYSEGMVDSPELNEFRAKMGSLPESSRMLENHIGTAPGIHLKREGVDIFALPGVPSEMIGMFEREVMPRLERIKGRRVRVEEGIIVPCRDESVISSVIKKIGEALPEVFIKPAPAGFSCSGGMKIFFSSYASREKVKEAERIFLDEIQEMIKKK